jgi:NAD(P)-dependent dehydrogenase (short-subunit alcohol dehydrogenase family)
MIAINLTGVWMCMKAELKAMEGKGGAIVNMASMAGIVGLSRSGPYTASKHGVIGLTRVAALEYSGAGIRVNALCPGYVNTPLTSDSLARNAQRFLAHLPIGRFADPNEVAQVAVWLCSDQASYVTGSAYGVDGGYIAGI